MSLDAIMVSSIMTRAVKTETEDQNIMAACKVMNDNNIGCVIIVKIQHKICTIKSIDSIPVVIDLRSQK